MEELKDSITGVVHLEVIVTREGDGDFALVKIRTDDNGSDMLTKTLPKEKLVACRAGLDDSLIHQSEGVIYGVFPPHERRCPISFWA